MKPERSLRGLFALALLVGWPARSAADAVVLQDGRLLDGVKIEQGEDSITIHFEHGDVVLRRGVVREIVLDGDAPFVPRNQEERDALEKGLVPYDGKFIPIKRRDQMVAKLLEEKRAELAEMVRRREWRNRLLDESKNFAFEATVPQHVYENYRDLCEAYFAEFVDKWKIRVPKELPKIPLKFYVDEEAFLQVTGMRPGVLGFFRNLQPYELNIFYDRLDPVGTEEVMYHEVGHYLQKLVDIEFSYPHWPGESICEYYAASVWDPVKKKLAWGGIHEGRVATIREDIGRGKWVGLEAMIRGAQDRNFHDYTWGWSFVHYLLSTKKYEENFRKFVLALPRDRGIDRELIEYGSHRIKTVTGDEMLATFMKFMKIKGPEELETLQREWYQHIEENLTITSARGLESAAHLASQLGRRHRAIAQYEEAIAVGTTNPLTYHRCAQLQTGVGRHLTANELWKKAVEIDPIVSDYYIGWGSMLIRFENTHEEGVRLLRLAQEIEPDNAYLERNLERLLKRKPAGKLADQAPEAADEDEEGTDAGDGAGSGDGGSDDGGDGGEGGEGGEDGPPDESRAEPAATPGG